MLLLLRLKAWKNEIAAKFRFNPSQGLPPTDLAKIRSKYSQIRATSYKVLQNGKTELQQIVATAISYGAFLAVLAIAVWWRRRWLRR